MCFIFSSLVMIDCLMKHKICFLYCALYPEDYQVRVDRLIDRWIGEGILGSGYKSNNIYDMYDEGESIIAKLKLSCMLEGVESNPPWFLAIKMHDMMRDMALWLARNEDRNKDKIIVEEEALSMSQMSSERLNVVERISIINHGEGSLKVLACPKLITLCVSSEVETIDFSHPQSMARLKVLDLPGYYVDGRDHLHLPVEIGKLINLEFLNLSYRGFSQRSLPIEFKNLKNLRVFLMEKVSCNLEIIPLEVIESLERLKVFRFHPLIEGVDGSREEALLERLESLPELEELCVTLQTLTGMRKLVNSTKLRGCSRHVRLLGMKEPLEMTSLLASLSTMKQLGHLTLNHVPNIMEGSSITDTCHLRKLRWVDIGRCNSITHLTWLKYAPLVELIYVHNCELIEEVVKGAEDEEGETDRENANDIFSNLRFLYLDDLPKLKSIHERVLGFPSLEYIDIYDCPNLRKLPLNSNSAKDLIEIKYDSDKWWNNLQWEDATIEDRLQTKLSL